MIDVSVERASLDHNGFKTGDWCTDSTKAPVLTAIFFVFFIVISALVMLSLFVGAVSMGMADAVDQMKDIEYQQVW